MNVNLKQEDFKNYPITQLEQLKAIVDDFNNVLSSKSEYISESFLNNENEIMSRLEPINKNFDFYFNIVNFKFDEKGTLLFYLDVYPEKPNILSSYKGYGTYNVLRLLYSVWSENIVKYHLIKFEDKIYEDYKNEIYQGIKILDENANSIPFDLEQQILFNNYLNSAKKLLIERHSFEPSDEIIQEIETLKSELTRLPKNSVMMKLSSILAKGKKFSLEVFNDMLKDFAKDVFKKQLIYQTTSMIRLN